MATDTPMDDARQDSDTNGSDFSDNEDGAAPIESLVAGRERRKTAGNRYDRDMVLDQADAADDPDEVTLLFAENEEAEDDEFKSDADDEDEMSSSDDEDQGPNAAAEDLEGEQELHNQAKQERAKKRKADLALTSVAGMRKKLKTDPTRPTTTSAPPKPSKKKERVTWVHDQDSGRSSLRKQTIAHRAETIARLKESEAQSKKMRALKEKRDRERAKDAPKELTQADRLAEAARVERQNAKSLNRWEATEKKRQEEQAAKMAALKDRKLEGPVVTWLSQKVKWYGPEPTKTVNKDMMETTGPKKRGRKSKAELEQIAAEKASETTNILPIQTTTGPAIPAATPLVEPPKTTAETTAPMIVPMALPPDKAQVAPAQAPSDENPEDLFLRGIHDYANQQTESNGSESKSHSPIREQPDRHENTETEKGLLHTEHQTPTESPSGGPSREPPVQPSLQPTISVENEERLQVKTEALMEQASISVQSEQQIPTPLIVEIEPEPEPPRVEEDSTRNLLILEKFDDPSSEARQQHLFFYNKRATSRTARPVKANQDLCLITTLPVRYRDPVTGIAYANAIAYKKLQELRNHEYAWSSMLGCHVGRAGGAPARGVPEGWM